jgi:hypothetical protein
MKKRVVWYRWCWLIPARALYCYKGVNGGCYGGVWYVWEWIETIEHYWKLYRRGEMNLGWFELRTLTGRHYTLLGVEDRRRWYSLFTGTLRDSQWVGFRFPGVDNAEEGRSVLGMKGLQGKQGVAGVRWWQRDGTGEGEKERDGGKTIIPLSPFWCLN